MPFIEEIEKILSIYQKWIGKYVLLMSIILSFLTVYLFNNYTLAGIDQSKHIKIFCIWLVLGSAVKWVYRKVSVSANEEKDNAKK